MSAPQTFSHQKEEETHSSLSGFSPLISRILFNRGFTDTESLERFLYEPYETGTHDPFLMKDMKRVVKRVQKAIADNETIAIFSDYDADGIPGAVALSEFLGEIDAHKHFVYIPHRGTEGFGLNTTALKEIADRGATLLITVDCGITDSDEISYANELGIETVITDHHTPLDDVLSAYAILNPKQDGCDYPYKELCGAGVVYKLIQALARNVPDFPDGREKWYLDLIGTATLADMVPLTGENRIFARYGLLVLRKSRRHGLQALFRSARVDLKRVTEDDVSFTLAPRVNAASRMDTPQVAFDLLSTTTYEEARTQAQELERLNRKRKTLVARIVKDVKKTLGEADDHPVVVTGNPHWKPGILGLVASSLVNAYNKPAFVWGREPGEEGVLKGSARSDGRVDLVELMRAVPDGVFANFGGHAMSGGFSIELSAVHDLSDLLSSALEACGRQDAAELSCDAAITPDDITPMLFDEIDQLSPFGVGNEKPIFHITNAQVQSTRLFGKDKNHMEITFRSNGGLTKAIGFFMVPDDIEQAIEEGATIDFLGTLEKSYFGGSLERRVRIVAFT